MSTEDYGPEQMRSERLGFPNARGQMLGARLDLPDGDPRVVALFAHCFTCTKNLKAVGNITRSLAERGIATLRFDFTGLGESEGDFAETGFTTNVTDLVAAAGYLEGEGPGAPSLLVGHSLGGAAVLRSAPDLHSVRAVATIAAPASPRHIEQHLKSDLDTIRREGRAEVLLAGRPFMITSDFLDDIDQARLQPAISSLEAALLVLHSPVDDLVGIDNATRIFELARHPKSFVSLDQADHLLSNEADSRYVGAVVAAWASRYL